MSITLICLVKGNTIANTFPVHINSNELVGELKKAIKGEKQNDFAGVDADKLKLWKVEISGDHDDQLKNLQLNENEELSAMNDIGDYWLTSPPKKHIHVIVKTPLLSLEEALSCIPPPVTYSPKCITSKSTSNINGDPPKSVQLWDKFFDQVNNFSFNQQPSFERPQFSQDREVVNEEDVRDALNSNICLVLNKLIGSEYKFSRLPTHAPGIPDFNCHLVGSLILVIEVKRKHVLEDIGDQTFPNFYHTNEKARMVIQQVYNYMGVSELRYGILATYDNHWFLRRKHMDLWISKTLPLQSKTPPVLKTYAYLSRKAKYKPKSLHPLQVVRVHGDNNSHDLRSHSKSTSSSSNQQNLNQQTSNQQSSPKIPVDQENYGFTDFKFKGILGEGRTGKTLICEFRGDAIALKSADLSKTPPFVLKEMQKEVEIYKELADIQGKYIPKLICYGYYGGGMSFVIGVTIVGTTLSKHTITNQQISMAVKGLDAIHDHGILHNDIREENILINDKKEVYLIDFGMASRADTKKKRKLFEMERLKYSNLLNRYNAHPKNNVKRISKSCKSHIVS